MADQRLLNYIWGYLQQGYDAQGIRASLLQQGYNQSAVDEAFAEVYKSNYHGSVQQPGASSSSNRIHITKTEWIVGGLVVLGLIIIGLFALSLGGGNPTDAGFELIEPTRVNRPTSAEPPLPSPDDTYPDVPDTRVPQQNGGSSDTGSIDAGQQIDNSVPTPLSPTPPLSSAGQRTLSRLEIDELVEDMAGKDPLTAITYCPQILTTNGENSCYAKVAIIAKQPKLCTYVSTEKQQDFCYMQFAIEGEGSQSICAQIRDTYRKESCLQLLALNAQLEGSDVPVDPATVDYGQVEQALTDDRFVAEQPAPSQA